MNRLKNPFLLKIIAIGCMVTLLAGTAFLSGCNEVLAKKEAVQISVEKVAEILKTQKDSCIILDVRTKEEFDSGHLDSAILIPVEELEARYEELSKEKPEKPIIVYCRSGSRSARAAAILVSKGFSQVYDMTGGINAWMSKGFPVVIENAGSVSGTSGALNSSGINSSGASDGQTAGQNTEQASGQASDQSSDQVTNQPSNQSDSQETGKESTQGTENINSTGESLSGDISTGETSATVGVRYITADELNAKVSKGEDIIILDVRSEDSYTAKHIKGAINIPYTDFEGRAGELDSSKEIVLYCSNFDCGLSANAAATLAKSGFKNVFALEGGIESWQTKGYPVE